MTATQTRLRRGTATQCDAMTPAADEPISDTTNNRIRIGNGTTPGGIHIPNAPDIQNQNMNYGVATGTGDAIAVALFPPLLAYEQGTSIEFQASAPNTGPATLDVDAIGPIALKKSDGSAVVDLAGNDIIAGSIYRATKNGTEFILHNPSSAPSTGIPQNSVVTFSGVSNVVIPVDFSIYSDYDIILSHNYISFAMTLEFSSNGGGAYSGYYGKGWNHNGATSLSAVSGVQTAYSYIMRLSQVNPTDRLMGTIDGIHQNDKMWQINFHTTSIAAAVNRIRFTAPFAPTFSGSYIVIPRNKR